MAAATGSGLYVKYTYGTSKGTLSGTATLSGKQRNLSNDSTIDTVDVSSGADTEKSFLTTLGDATFTLTMLDDFLGGSATHRACARGNHGTLEWGPLGTATGNPKYSCMAFVTGFSTEYPYDGEVEYEVEFQKDGAWITNFEISGSTY